MKKILILGGNPTEIEILKRAKKLGYYTIVTDNHTDWNLSPAKKCADEGWDISWSDIDSLEKKCREENVNGVLAGFSEFRVENMIKLCKRLNLPCSLTMNQLEITRDKIKFKETCRKYSIETVPEYEYGKPVKFPVIVKPVDRAGSIGINVANNETELETFYLNALSLSPSKHVVIEDYITDGVKFDVYYYVQGEKIYFLGSSDTIMCNGVAGAKILQKCWPFKSKYEDLYKKDVDANVKAMFTGLGIQNAYATMSAFYLNEKFYFFEAGFRLSGEMSFNYYEAATGINYIDSMLKYALNDVDDVSYADSTCDKFSAVLNFFSLDGCVADILGVQTLKEMTSVYDVKLYVNKGDIIHNKTNVFSKAAMITLVAENKEQLKKAIKFVNTVFDIRSTQGNSLIYERVNNSDLIHYYGN